MKKLDEKQLHPNEIDSDSTVYESSNNSVSARTTALPPDESTDFVNSMQISQAVLQDKNDNQTKATDSSFPVGETLPLPTAEEVNQALLNSGKNNSNPEDTQTFYPTEDSHLTEPINSSDSFDNPNESTPSQFDQQTETLPIYNQSFSDTNVNYDSANMEQYQYEQINYQNAGNVFDNPNGNYGYMSVQQDDTSSYGQPETNSAPSVKSRNNSLFLKRFIPIALMAFSVFASMGIIAHAAMNQNYGGLGYGPQGGMYSEDYYGGYYSQDGSGYGYDDGSGHGYGYNNGNAQTQSAITLAENSTPSDNNSGNNNGKSGNNNTPSDSNSKGDANGGHYRDYAQGGMPGDGGLQGPPEGDMGYMEMSYGLTTPYVLALAFCAIVFACSLIYIIVTRFGTRPFALDKNTKLFSALGVAGIALVMTGGLTAGGNTLMALSSGLSGGNRYGDAGSGYDYGYYDDYSDGYDDGYGYYDDYGDYYYYDNGNNGYTDDNNGNSKDRSKDRSNNNQQPNTNSGSDVNAFDTNNIPYTDI